MIHTITTLPIKHLFSLYYGKLSLAMLILSDDFSISLNINEEDAICRLTITLTEPKKAELIEKRDTILQWLVRETDGQLKVES